MRYHEIMENIEPISAPAFHTALTETLRAMMIGWVETPAKINEGLCGEFAAQVMKRFGMQLWDKSPTLRSSNTKWFYGDDDRTLDLDRLREIGEPVPQDIDDKKMAYELGSVHYWLVFEGKNYDAECLQGVEHFLDLPYFQKIIARLRSH